MKYTLILENEEWLTIGSACKLFGVSRSGYYYWKARADKRLAEEVVAEQLLAVINAEFAKSRDTYGSVKITESLQQKEVKISHNTVAKIMRGAGLKSRVSQKFKPQTTDSNNGKAIYENWLKREFTVPCANYAWCGDVTYIATDEGWLYLATVIDLYSNKVIGYATSDKIDRWLVVKALSNALQARGYPRGVIMHTDRGSNYCSNVYRHLIKQNSLVGSMSRKGNCWDNAVAENFFGLIKKEVLNHLHFETRAKAELVIFDYINGWYNPNRIHSKLGYMSPNEFEARNQSQTKTKLNSVKCCKKSQLLVELTNLAAAMS